MADAQNIPEDPGLPLGDIALDMVRKGDPGGEPFKIHPQGAAVLEAAVLATLLSGERNDAMAQRFRGVIAVCYVLETKKESPKAAAVLAEALFKDPRVAKTLTSTGAESRSAGLQYSKFLDEGDIAKAPSLDDEVPDDSVKLKSFMNPGRDLTSAARQRQHRSLDALRNRGRAPAPDRDPDLDGPDPNEKKKDDDRRTPGSGLPPHARKG